MTNPLRSAVKQVTHRMAELSQLLKVSEASVPDYLSDFSLYVSGLQRLLQEERAARAKIEAATANLGAQLIVSESTAQRQADELQALRQQLEEQQFDSRSECQRYATENVVLQRRIEEQALAISSLEGQVAELSRQQHNNKGQDNNCVPQEQFEAEVQELKLQCSALHSALKSEEQQRQLAEEKRIELKKRYIDLMHNYRLLKNKYVQLRPLRPTKEESPVADAALLCGADTAGTTTVGGTARSHGAGGSEASNAGAPSNNKQEEQPPRLLPHQQQQANGCRELEGVDRWNGGCEAARPSPSRDAYIAGPGNGNPLRPVTVAMPHPPHALRGEEHIAATQPGHAAPATTVIPTQMPATTPKAANSRLPREPPEVQQLAAKKPRQAHAFFQQQQEELWQVISGRDDSAMAPPPSKRMPLKPAAPRLDQAAHLCNPALAAQAPTNLPVATRSPAWKQAKRGKSDVDLDEFPGRVVRGDGAGPAELAMPQVAERTAANSAAMGMAAAAGEQKQLVFKYQEVVRKRDEREKLKAFECEQCGRFYQACTSWGCLPSNAAPSCGHGTAGVREALRSEGGRHRYRFPPPPTPEGYWDISFTPPGKEEADAAGWEEVHAHYERRL